MKKNRVWPVLYLLTATIFLMCVHLTNKAITVISRTSPLPRAHCIIIDPGHGGEDGGATSCTGVLESTYNLQIAHRLNDLLGLLGYDTKMTRTTDISIYTKGESLSQKKMSDLKERVRITNETENGILISIHQNIFPNSQYSGAQVFYAEGAESVALAKQMQALLVSALNPGSRRACKQSSGIYLMEHIQKPGILIECGFLSNPREEALLRTPEYQKKLCCVMAAGLDAFLSNT